MRWTHRFEIYRDRRGEYRWRLKTQGGRIMADSGEGYTRAQDAKRAIARVVVVIRATWASLVAEIVEVRR